LSLFAYIVIEVSSFWLMIIFLKKNSFSLFWNIFMTIRYFFLEFFLIMGIVIGIRFGLRWWDYLYVKNKYDSILKSLLKW